jgi:hypothetical protein
VKVGPNYHSFDIIFLLVYRGILVFYFHYNRTLKIGGEASIQLFLSHLVAILAFLRSVDVLHDVKEEMRESERSLKSSKE